MCCSFRHLAAAVVAAGLLAGCGAVARTPNAAVPKAPAAPTAKTTLTPVTAAPPDKGPNAAGKGTVRIQYVIGNGMMNFFTIMQGSTLNLRAYVSNPGNRRLTYRWSGPGMMGFNETATMMGGFAGNTMFDLTVSDDQGGRDWQMYTVQIKPW